MNKRVRNRYHGLKALHTELRPYIEGRKKYDLSAELTGSKPFIQAVRTFNALELCFKAWERRATSGTEVEFEEFWPQAVALSELLKAIRLGRSHALLEYWRYTSSSSDRAGTIASPKVIEWRRNSAVCVIALTLTKQKLTRSKAKELVAEIVKETAVDPECKTTTVQNWLHSATRLKPGIEHEARDLAKECCFDAGTVLASFQHALKEHAPDLTDLGVERRGPKPRTQKA